MRGSSGLPGLGPKQKTGQNGGKGKDKRETEFPNLKTLQTIEFKCKFEFKQFKIMHQHVCNIPMIHLFSFENY
jgi:hypothetical protein